MTVILSISILITLSALVLGGFVCVLHLKRRLREEQLLADSLLRENAKLKDKVLEGTQEVRQLKVTLIERTKERNSLSNSCVFYREYTNELTEKHDKELSLLKAQLGGLQIHYDFSIQERLKLEKDIAFLREKLYGEEAEETEPDTCPYHECPCCGEDTSVEGKPCSDCCQELELY